MDKGRKSSRISFVEMTKLNKKSCIRISKNLQKGDLLLWRKYELNSGKKKDKILIILNSYEYKFIIFVLTTSQTKIYDKNPYAVIDTVRFPAKKLKCFPLETVVDIKRWKTQTINYFGEKFYNNDLKLIGRLPEEAIKAIDTCIEEAITLNAETKNLILGK